MKDGLSRALEAVRHFAAPAAKLSPDELARLQDQRVESNRTRTASVMPVVALMQIAMVIVFRPQGGVFGSSFREGAFLIHASTLPVTAALSLVARRKARVAWFGDVVVVYAIALGLALSLNTHRLIPNLNAFTVAVFAAALVIRPTLPGAILGYGGAIVGLVWGGSALQPVLDARLAMISSGTSAALISFFFSRVLDISLVRDVVQRVTIEQQKGELVAWNAELERRVKEQVAETLAHADQVRALDAQLRVKVRDRSRQLARALRAPVEGQDGAEIAPGKRFEDRYDIERSIGSGAMGDVYAARDHVTGQPVAIKVLRRSEDLSPDDIERFVSEAAAAATVVHPAIVRTYHVDITESGCFYLAMELVAGRTLAEDLERGRFDAGQTARLGSVVAEALAAAHATGVVHRDIKPHNLMLTAAPPGIRVLDFGVSKLLDADSGLATTAGQVVGTPQYMAPEQILQNQKLTGACDVYALGQVLYEMLAGEPCFTGKTVREVLRAQVGEAPVSVRMRAGADVVPEDLSGLIAHCLQKDPKARPAADSLAAALRVIADGLGAPPLEAIGPPRHQGPRIEGLDFAAATVRAGH